MFSTDLSGDMVMLDSVEFDLSETPKQFRFTQSPKKTARLVRNCESCVLYSPWLGGGVKVQKGDMLDLLKNYDDTVLVFSVFDGINLTVIGAINTEDE